MCNLTEYDYLGLKLTNTLSWRKHMEKPCSKFYEYFNVQLFTNNVPVYLCDHFNAVLGVHFYRTNLYVIYMYLSSNREAFKQSLLYMGSVKWTNLPSCFKSASSFKNLHWFLLGAGEEYSCCNQSIQDK